MAIKPEKKHGSVLFLYSYVSLRDDFANDMRSKKNCVGLGTRTLSEKVSYASSTKHCFVVVAQLIFQPCSESVRILKKLPWTSIFSSDKLFPVSLSFC